MISPIKTLRLLVFTGLLVLAVGCASNQILVPVSAPTVLPARPAVLRVEVPGDPNAIDMPRLLAVEILRSEGITVETISLGDTTTAIVALEQGDVDFSSESNLPTWSAILKGAPIVTILDESNSAYLIVAAEGVQQCADLDGKKVGMANLSGTNAALFYEYIKRHCPEAEPEYLVIPGKNNRIAALMSGNLDAAIAELPELIQLQQEGVQGVHPLVFFANEFPGLTSLSLSTRRELAEKYPAAVRDFIRAQLLARRQLQDPQVLRDALVRYLGIEPEQAKVAAETYLANKTWDLNGGYTPERVQRNIDFLAAAGDLPTDTKAAAVADLSYLNTVLDEIGRK